MQTGYYERSRSDSETTQACMSMGISCRVFSIVI